MAQTTAPTVRHLEIKLELDRAQPNVTTSGKERLITLAVPLEQAAPFLAVGFVWPQAAGQTRLKLRSSADGVTWSEWLKLAHDADATNENGEQASSLALLPAQTRFIQCHSESDKAPIRSLRVLFISPGATPRGMREQIQSKIQTNVMSQQPSTKYPKPPVVTRTEWGCPDGQITTHGTLSYTTVTHLIVHHTATGNTVANSDWPAVMRSIWNFHIFSNGWADIGYNYLVDPNGVIYEGRAGGDNVLGAHFSGVNAGTLGVSMIGTFTDVTPSEQALNSLRRLLAWKADQRGIDPTSKSRHAASGLELNNISGHRDGPGSTECPGDALYPLLPSLRESVKALLTSSAAATVSAASFSADALAGEAIVASFGNELATATQAAATTPLPLNLAGTTVVVRDSANVERPAPLFFVSPGQVNFQIPAGTKTGPAAVLIGNPAGRIASGTITVEPVAPALFAANSNGREVPAAVVLRVKADGAQSYEPVAVFDQTQNKFVATPIDVSNPNEQVFLIAFGSGFRNRTALAAVAAQVGGELAPVLFAGAVEGLVGLDQLNVRLPGKLVGRGEVDFLLQVDGKTADTLQIRIK
ncbi:MAG: N-acetylmuramoyl-L-alanine amidase [Acidobacteria bacterium]|nr:N-acetylmuramoyl-L-alanine amidase [Acidobacteriota bacterium]MBI3424393.1 N-acetylmuramoyl-L-alanine amidase [Acidobacteriota bacterium]